MPEAYPIHCHRCSSWVGETSEAVELVGVFRAARDRSQVPTPRLTWRCKGCGWTNVFRVSKSGAHGSWRDMETKAGAASG